MKGNNLPLACELGLAKISITLKIVAALPSWVFVGLYKYTPAAEIVETPCFKDTADHQEIKF